ncbi:TPA: sel1 repeat family protein, partial [Pasteurella multocida]|nr:sel1 repeat family protein [Pasteurella multocida]
MNKRHSVIILFSFIFTACTDTPHTISESHLYESVSQVVEQARETVDLNLLNQAKLGNAKSQRQLGVYYEDNGAYSEAFYWFKKSAEQGYVIGQYNLAHCYLKGSGISKDLSKAFYWFEQAASQNDSPAQYNLGTMYLNGEGVIKDIQKGIYWLKRSAQSNFKLALYKLGRFYHTGQYIPKNNKIALDLLKKAA